jgi:hypothetical protein
VENSAPVILTGERPRLVSQRGLIIAKAHRESYLGDMFVDSVSLRDPTELHINPDWFVGFALILSLVILIKRPSHLEDANYSPLRVPVLRRRSMVSLMDESSLEY